MVHLVQNYLFIFDLLNQTFSDYEWLFLKTIFFYLDHLKIIFILHINHCIILFSICLLIANTVLNHESFEDLNTHLNLSHALTLISSSVLKRVRTIKNLSRQASSWRTRVMVDVPDTTSLYPLVAGRCAQEGDFPLITAAAFNLPFGRCQEDSWTGVHTRGRGRVNLSQPSDMVWWTPGKSWIRANVNEQSMYVGYSALSEYKKELQLQFSTTECITFLRVDSKTWKT